MSERGRTLGIELAVFGALAWFAAAHWADGLVADAPADAVAASALIATAAAFGIALAGRLPSRVQRISLTAVCALAAFGLGLVTVGLDNRHLVPGNWDELADGIDRGLTGLAAAEWPYSGSEPWTRLALLMAIPPVLSLAASLSFGPGRRMRPAGLVLLVALYGTAVTEHQFGGELARGVALLLLVAAWLWLPRASQLGTRGASVAAATVAVACIAALPAAARYDDRRAWVDYESWNPFVAGAADRFDWSHSYGPIDWPREGNTLLTVRSDSRHYWKVETLDRFDGFAWGRWGYGRGNSPLLPIPYRLEWEETFEVTIRGLETDLFPIAGTAVEIKGADPVVVPSEDGTVEAVGESLEEGDSYEVTAYVPNPTPEQMRAAPSLLPAELAHYKTVYLPPPGTTALDGSGRAGDAAREAVDRAQLPARARDMLASPYARVLKLARRLARGQPTTYDKVHRIQRYLRANYRYNERPPSQEFPLAAFLFEDRIGYCQQFSGAMALMLRMLGIPTRVAAGFTPGSYNRETKEYRVRDLDAHSWVEVWFTGLGWVPFDPTPAVAPAESQSGVDDASASSGLAGAPETPDRRGGQSTSALSERAGGGAVPPPTDESDSPVAGWAFAAGLGLLGLLGVALAKLRARLRRRRTSPHDRELAELYRALERMGEPAPAGTTLASLEARLAARAGAPGVSYLRLLRERRYSPAGGPAPGAHERRAMRRALGAQGGLLRRLRTLAALPPVAFRRG